MTTAFSPTWKTDAEPLEASPVQALTDLMQNLRGHWQFLLSEQQELSEQWRDAYYLRFRKSHWAKWQETVPDLLAALDDLDQVMQQAQLATRDP